MRKTLSICYLNFKQAIRDKIFFGVSFFFFFYLAFCVFLEKLSPGESEKILRNAGLSGIELTAVFLIIFSFTSSFYRERDTRILEVYLTNFSRSAYITGKLAGYFLVLLLYLVSCAIGYVGLLFVNHAFQIACLIALYPALLKIILILCFTSIFSCLFSSWFVCILSSFSVYIAAEFLPATIKIISASGSAFEKSAIQMLYAFSPAMDKLDIKSLAVYGQLPPGKFFLSISLYAVIYSFFLWRINLFVFRKREY